MYEYSLQAVANPRCVPPKRILAKRLLRSVEARNSADQAPDRVLRPVEVRSVSASEYRVTSQTMSRLPRLFASGSEGSRQRLADVAKSLKRAARANLVLRMSERFANDSRRCVTAREFLVQLRGSSRLLRSSRLQ